MCHQQKTAHVFDIVHGVAAGVTVFKGKDINGVPDRSLGIALLTVPDPASALMSAGAVGATK